VAYLKSSRALVMEHRQDTAGFIFFCAHQL
jgi:hypothetical protein